MKIEKTIFPKVSKIYRKHLGLNQREVIEKAMLGIDVNTLSNYENGYSDAPTSILLKLAEFYDCSLDALISRSFHKPVSQMANFTRYDYAIQNGIGAYTALLNQTSYSFDVGIDPDKHTYAHFRLLQDDPNVDLPKHTRLIVLLADSIIEIDRMNEQIYLVSDMIKDEARNRNTTTFFTKAGMVKLVDGEPHTSNLIYYSYNNEIKFDNLRHFKSIIDGIVVKVFMDPLTK